MSRQSVRVVFQSGFIRETLIFTAWCLLTIAMTWPWAVHFRNAVTDEYDPYIIAWTLWWDFHQTFHAPLHLFNANIYFPYHQTLAFGENDYGIALLFFPLFALGVRPLTVHCIATLTGYALSAYGAFRLTRTLTASNHAAIVAGIVFAFAPYHFFKLPHLHYLFTGWIPLLAEALILFLRCRSWRTAMWLGTTFLMNALTSITWFLITFIPLALLAAVLIWRCNLVRDRRLYWRGGIALGVAMLTLLPFLIPYYQVSKEYRFKRTTDENAYFSAQLSDWLLVDSHNKFWTVLGGGRGPAANPETSLFPGLLPPLFSLFAIIVIFSRRISLAEEAGSKESPVRDSRILIRAIDVILLIGILLVFLLRAKDPTLVEMSLLVLAIVRLCIRYPRFIWSRSHRSLLETVRSKRSSDVEWAGMIFAVLGFAGSLGMNFFFYRFLFEYVPAFSSQRVPARWAMICNLGLALLAGVGVSEIVRLLGSRKVKATAGIAFALICCAFLFEQRVAPLEFTEGEERSNSFTDYMRTAEMNGGLVELPTGSAGADHLYTLRSADHGRPLITASNSFVPPIKQEIDALANEDQIRDRFMDLLETIPASFLAIHRDLLVDTISQQALDDFLRAEIARNRLRYLRSFDDGSSIDLYAVVKTEPSAVSGGPLPPLLTSDSAHLDSGIDNPVSFVKQQYVDILGREPDPGGLRYWTRQLSPCKKDLDCGARARAAIPLAFITSPESETTSGFVLRLYKAALGVQPTFNDFISDRNELRSMRLAGLDDARFIDAWLKRKALTNAMPVASSSKELVDRLCENSSVETGTFEYEQLVNLAKNGQDRAQIISTAVGMDAFKKSDPVADFVRLNYFTLLRRDPDPAGYEFWLRKIKSGGTLTRQEMTAAFINSKEYRDRFNQ